MIAIRLLGGAKKAVGKPSVDLDRPSASVADILSFLAGISTDARLLQPNNLIVAVNGVDSAALQGRDTMAKTGDIVTIVTVVHGGTLAIDSNHVAIIGVQKISGDAGKLVDRLRAGNKGVLMQAVNAGAVYGEEHLLGVLRVTLEAEKRKVMIVNKIETEFLLRLACVNQIAEAIRRAGLKENEPGCFIAFSRDRSALQQFSDQISKEFQVDDSVIKPDKEKRTRLAGLLGINAKFAEDEFLQYLLERAAILVK